MYVNGLCNPFMLPWYHISTFEQIKCQMQKIKKADFFISHWKLLTRITLRMSPVMESYFSSMPSPRPSSRLGNKQDDPKTALTQRRYVVLLVEISSDFVAAFLSSNRPISRYVSTLSFALVLLWTHPRRSRLVNDPSVWLRPCRRRDVHHPPEEKAKLQKHCLVHAAGSRRRHLTSPRTNCSRTDQAQLLCARWVSSNLHQPGQARQQEQ